MKPTWQLKIIKEISNCYLVEFCILNEDIHPLFHWIHIGVLTMPKAIYDKAVEEKIINREILCLGFENENS